MHIEDNLRSGLNPAEARRQGLIKLGGIEQAKEKYRDQRGIAALETVLQDIRFGLRMLRRNPGFTAVAVLTLVLGIGANTAIFSVVNAVLLRPLPFPDPGRLMMISHTLPQKSFPGVARFVVSPANYLDWKQRSRSFEHLAAYREWDVNLTGINRPDHIQAALASPELFRVLGIEPALGRTFWTTRAFRWTSAAAASSLRA